MPNPISTSLTLNVLKIYQNFLSQGIYAIKCSKTGRNRGGNSILKYWYTILDTEKFEIYLQFIEHFNCLCHIDLQIFKKFFSFAYPVPPTRSLNLSFSQIIPFNFSIIYVFLNIF